VGRLYSVFSLKSAALIWETSLGWPLTYLEVAGWYDSPCRHLLHLWSEAELARNVDLHHSKQIPALDYMGDMVRGGISGVSVGKVVVQPCVLLATSSSLKRIYWV